MTALCSSPSAALHSGTHYSILATVAVTETVASDETLSLTLSKHPVHPHGVARWPTGTPFYRTLQRDMPPRRAQTRPTSQHPSSTHRTSARRPCARPEPAIHVPVKRRARAPPHPSVAADSLLLVVSPKTPKPTRPLSNSLSSRARVSPSSPMLLLPESSSKLMPALLLRLRLHLILLRARLHTLSGAARPSPPSSAVGPFQLVHSRPCPARSVPTSAAPLSARPW